MEKRKFMNSRLPHHNPLQILDVNNHLRTLIHVGYPSEAINSSASKMKDPKNHTRLKAIMDEGAIWRRFQSNAAGNEAIGLPKKRIFGSSYGRKGWPKVVTPISRLRGSFKDYCKHCTIHGLKYIGDTSLLKFERIFWMISFTLALSGAAFFIWHLYSKFTASPIIISRSSQSVSIDEIPFPALTICNMNMVKKSLADKVLRGNDDLQKFLLDDICNKEGDTSFVSSEVKKEANDWSHRVNFIREASPSCTDTLYYCKWNSNATNCTNLFKRVFTDDGLCCNFNVVKRLQRKAVRWIGLNGLGINYWALGDYVDWNPEYAFKKTDSPNAIPLRGRSSGVSHGLTLALDVHLDEYYCSSTASAGFKMLLHSPVEMPQISDYGFTLAPGRETRVIITPHITDADKAIMKIPPKIRQCYFLHERKLRYYRTYTEGNCLLECEANFTLRMCQCMEYYMPVENETKICGKLEDECTARAKKVMAESLKDNDNTQLPSCKCYPGCHEIYYNTQISHSMLVASFEIGNEYWKNNASYFEKNVAIVHVFYVDDSYIKYTKKELYGFVELLSNTGGLLGLFMGFSLLSVMEIVYYLLLWLRRSLLRKRGNKEDKTKFQTNRAIKKRRDAVYPFAQ